MGHIARNCPDKKGGAAALADALDNLQCYNAMEAIIVNTEAFVAAGSSDEAIFDSGCNRHLTSRHDLLHDYRDIATGSFVRYGGTETTPIMGVGTLASRRNVDGVITDMRVPHVHLVQTTCKTLISSSQLMKDLGAKLNADAHKGDLKLDNGTIVPLVYTNGLMVMQARLVSPTIEPEATFVDGMIMHERMCHPGAEVLKVLQSRGLLPEHSEGPKCAAECTSCQLGKAKCVTRVSTTQSRATAPGERLHTDLAFPGPVDGGIYYQ
jgi:GAG-pre-integrase domain